MPSLFLDTGMDVTITLGMKLLFSEHVPQYETYAFPYQVWGIEEVSDNREQLLAQGFLPSRMKIGLWYLARSLRVDLEKFELSSENRRVVKKTSPYHFTIQSSSSIQITNTELLWMRQYVLDVIGSDSISDHAIKRMFSPHVSDMVFVWRKQDDDRIAGMVPVLVHNKSFFYWMAFIHLSVNASGLGSRMMLEVIQWAKNGGLQFAYLGTVYTLASLYKTNYDGAQFFDGMGWNNEMEALTYLVNKTKGPELMKDKEWIEMSGATNLSEFIKRQISSKQKLI